MRVLDHLRVERVGHLVAAFERAIGRLAAGVGARQHGVEVDVVHLHAAAIDLAQ